MKTYLLNNGLTIPSIGFGTFPQKDTLIKSVELAYRAGIRLFDISDNYNNEVYLGEAIQKGNVGSDSVVLTKFSQPSRFNEVEKCFEESQARLGGKIDIYLMHWPYPFLWKEIWKRMELLYFEGKCKGIGVCNFEVEKLQELLSVCRVKPVINQFERHPLFQQNKIVEYCRNNDIRVMSYAPTARQDSELFGSALLKSIAEKYQKSVGQIILRWNIETGTVPIPGSKNEKHIQDNINIFDFQLSENEIDSINKMECGKRIRFDPKTRFTTKEKIKFALYKTGMR